MAASSSTMSKKPSASSNIHTVFGSLTPYIPRVLPPSSHSHTINTAITVQELSSAIQALSVGKATGPDNVPNEFLHRLPDPLILLLLNVFNASWLSGTFPSVWRRAITIPILKPGKDPLEVSSNNIDTRVKHSRVELIYPLKKKKCPPTHHQGHPTACAWLVNKFPDAYIKFHHIKYNFGRDMNFPKWDHIYIWRWQYTLVHPWMYIYSAGTEEVKYGIRTYSAWQTNMVVGTQIPSSPNMLAFVLTVAPWMSCSS